MKKILAIAIVVVMTAALCVSANAALNIDRIHVNNNCLDVTPNVMANDPIEINKGDMLYTLGWAYSDTALKKIVYTIDDGADVACPDNYRNRPDLVTHFGDAVPNGGDHAGFGSNNTDDGAPGMIELPGIESLAEGTYKLTIKAVYEDDSSESKDFNLKIGQGGEPSQPEETQGEVATADPITVDMTESMGSNVEVEVSGSKIVCTTNGTDPWVSIPLDNIDTSVYKYFTITYTATKEIGSNNTYLMDTEVNPAYSGVQGTWAPNGMGGTGDGERHTKTYSIDKDFPLMKGTTLTGVRFTGCTEADLGGVFTVESVVFHCTADPEQGTSQGGSQGGTTTPTETPRTADASVIAIAAVACVALAGVVIAKKVR